MGAREATEKRNAPRRRALKTAGIIISEKAPTIPCSVKSLSEIGAALQLSTVIGIPQKFDVVIDGQRQRCRAVWRTETKIGITFE